VNQITIALVGQPNVGKSMLINAISNARMHVGNFTGVTVEKAEAFFEYQGYRFHIVDLPGTYSLNDFSRDERVTKEFLENDTYDVILNVLDSTNLQRNLGLSSELIELKQKMVMALNMGDEALKEGIRVDTLQLESILNVPVLQVSALEKKGLEKLLEQLIQTHEAPLKEAKLVYSDVIEEEIARITGFLSEKNFKSRKEYREIAIGLLKEDKRTYQWMHEEPVWTELSPILHESLEHIYIHFNTKDLDEVFSDEKQGFVRGLVTETVSVEKQQSVTLTERIDRFLIHKFFGIPIFLLFMWSMFQITFELGSIPMDWIDGFFGWLGERVGEWIPHDGLRSLIVDGIIAGVGAVVLFLPNIMILFLGIALLEGTGYMARVAFLLDGFFHRFGLHGKSFIPLVTGFGCSVPAYMAARTLKSEKDRLITLFIIGFMSCGARLPVYVLFAGAFFSPESAGNILFIIYFSGAILGLIAAKVLKTFVFKGGDEPFVMEMPKYRMPSPRLIWHTVYTKSLMYLKKAGTFILAATILIWFASTYPKQDALNEQYAVKIEAAATQAEAQHLENERARLFLENSYLGIIGKATEPLFAPLGFNWQMTVALETGLAAKEIVVATLGVLYSLGEEVGEDDASLMAELRRQIPLAAALSFIAFVMIYLPCLAASMVFAREAGGWKYLGYLFVFTTATAYIIAFIVYRTALLML